LEAFKAADIARALVAYDRDDAGDSAAEDLAARLAEEGITSFRVLFPKGMDANEYATHLKPAKQALGLLLRSAVYMAGPLASLSPVEPMIACMIEESCEILPPPPAEDPPVALGAREAIFRFGKRRWRVRGLSSNLSLSSSSRPPKSLASNRRSSSGISANSSSNSNLSRKPRSAEPWSPRRRPSPSATPSAKRP